MASVEPSTSQHSASDADSPAFSRGAGISASPKGNCIKKPAPLTESIVEKAMGSKPFVNEHTMNESIDPSQPLQVRCYGRTRVPTSHGELFLHLYRNNHDEKEHLALVIDPAQNQPSIQKKQREGSLGLPRHIRSRTLDKIPSNPGADTTSRAARRTRFESGRTSWFT